MPLLSDPVPRAEEVMGAAKGLPMTQALKEDLDPAWELSHVTAITCSAGDFLCDPRQFVSLSKAAFLLVKLL